MKVRVQLFAVLRERAGSDAVELDLADGATVAEAIAELAPVANGMPFRLAVNREYAPDDQAIAAGDELAAIPPVSGGAGPHVRVTEEPLSADALSRLVVRDEAGAVVTFHGVTREVDKLEYEAYTEMAEKKMAAILDQCVERHGLCAAAAEHRIGTVPLGEPSVIVAVSAGHRGEAFAGAREAIDRIKAEAPIWKKEISGGGEAWVEGALP